VNRFRVRGEHGSALVSAMLVMGMMLMIGLASMATVDTQTSQSGKERGRETAFNWVEGALNAQTFTVANKWPAAANQAVHDCTWNGTGNPVASGGIVNACPAPAVIRNTFDNNVDVEKGATWTTQTRDNTGTAQCEDTANSNCSYSWDEATSLNAARWDQNGDNLMWLRADATSDGDRRVVVALVRINHDPLALPQAAILAGSLSAKAGNKGVVYQNGAPIVLRCGPITDPACFDEQKPGINVVGPGSKVAGYADDGHVMTEDELDSMRTAATNINRYYGPGQCPSTAAAFTGAVVFLESPPDNCKINHNWQINKPPLEPGILIVAQGRLQFNGNADFWGLIYMYNAQNAGPDDPPFFGNGNFNLNGALFVDGQGGVENTGSFTLQYNANAVNGVTAYGATGIVPNSFREINP
jgi:Tfp pilus assembly protein PilX